MQIFPMRGILYPDDGGNKFLLSIVTIYQNKRRQTRDLTVHTTLLLSALNVVLYPEDQLEKITATVSVP
jgi:hypothetical protein